MGQRVRVITARRDDRCRECGGAIGVGDLINYGGPGAVSHAGCRPLANVRTRYGRRVYGGVSATGLRCEDAPCCGCCS
jgi:hypothetical protein